MIYTNLISVSHFFCTTLYITGDKFIWGRKFISFSSIVQKIYYLWTIFILESRVWLLWHITYWNHENRAPKKQTNYMKIWNTCATWVKWWNTFSILFVKICLGINFDNKYTMEIFTIKQQVYLIWNTKCVYFPDYETLQISEVKMSQ